QGGRNALVTDAPPEPQQDVKGAAGGPSRRLPDAGGDSEDSGGGVVSPNGRHFEVEIQIPSKECNPEYIIRGADGNVWVSELVANKIARVTPSGDLTEFDVPTPLSGPAGIALAPGGMWFSELYANQLAWITYTGEITEVQLSVDI